MGPLALPFILIPGAASVATAWAVRDWRIAGAVAAGAWGLLFLLSGLRLLGSIFLAPVLVGVGIAGGLLLVLLLLRPGTDVWTRMTLCLAVTVAAGLWLVSTNPGVA
jgi:hypothetical protein